MLGAEPLPLLAQASQESLQVLWEAKIYDQRYDCMSEVDERLQDLVRNHINSLFAQRIELFINVSSIS